MVNTEKNRKEEILVYAEKMLHYNDLLIAQCDNWLSVEEGMKYMEKRIFEKMKKKRMTNQKILEKSVNYANSEIL